MEKQKRITNLDEKIFLTTFSEPRYKAEISNMLYGKEKKTIYPKINELIELGWIKELKNYSPEEEDGRAKKRVYLQGTIKPFYDRFIHILKESDESLSQDEKKQLKQFLDSDSFRSFCNVNPKNITIDYCIENMCYWFTFIIVDMNFRCMMYKDAEIADEFKNMDDGLISLIASGGSYRSEFFLHMLYRLTDTFMVAFNDFVHLDKEEQQRVINKIDKWYKMQKEMGILESKE